MARAMSRSNLRCGLWVVSAHVLLLALSSAQAQDGTATVGKAPDVEAVLLDVDLGTGEGAVEGLGGVRARRFEGGYPAYITAFVPTEGTETTLRVRLLAAGSEGAKLGVRVLCYGAARSKLSSVGTGLWSHALGDDFADIGTGEVGLAEGTHSIRVAVYCSNKRGVLWLKWLRVEQLFTLPCRELAAGLRTRLQTEGYRTATEGDHLVGVKPDERCYYRLFRGQRMTRTRYEATRYAGSTWLRAEFRPTHFVAGPYIYGAAERQQARARALGIGLDEFFEHLARDVHEHGCNTIYYANLSMDPGVFRRAVAAARKHGVRVFGQLTRDLYLRPKNGRAHYETVTLPTARRILPQYHGLEGVAAWMPKEEATADEMPWVAEYRAEVRGLDPTHAIFTLHNSIDAFRAERDPLPEWFGFDRYRFRCLHGPYGILISTPKDMASRLGPEMAQFHAEAAKRGRPLLYVGQSYGHQNRVTGPMLREWSGGDRERPDPWSGFREVEPGTWLGWDRYPPPKHGMHLQTWLAVAEGAKGILLYHYGPGDATAESPKCIQLVDRQGKETRLWREFAEAMRDVTPFAPLILSWHKEALPRARADHPEVAVRSFVRRFDAERFLVVQNRRIATWDKDSPGLPRGPTELHFDHNGLAGLHEAGPLTTRLAVEGANPLWDIRSGEELVAAPGQSGTYEVTLGPGRGTVLMQGSADALNALRRELYGAAAAESKR